MENYELIEKYLNKEMNEEELEKFRLKLKTNKELRKELNLISDVNEFLKNDNPKFKDELKQMVVSYSRRGKQVSFNHYLLKPINIAAMLLVLVGFSFFFYYNFRNSSEQLFKQYFQPYPYSVVQRSTGTIQNRDNITLAFQEYNNLNYTKAIILFNKSFKNDTTNNVAKFLLANCYMQTNQIDKAIEVFKQLSVKENYLFHNNIIWYFGLSYLKNKENEKARRLFKELAENDNTYSERANQLLRKIK